MTTTGSLIIIPAIRLEVESHQQAVANRLAAGERVFIYFDAKLGGELSIPATARSPEFSFDVTIFEIVLEQGKPHVGRFGVLELQTTDFHGTYKHAVNNLTNALQLHPTAFASQVQSNQNWLSQEVEGPNIANVFKRTFYQMMFKFQLAQDARCAGCGLAIAASVWDSWQRHLASPSLTASPDGSFRLFRPNQPIPSHIPAWIFVFDTHPTSTESPSPLVFSKIIATDAPSMSHFALNEAPAAALSNIYSPNGLFGLMHRRLRRIWPELSNTISFEQS